MYLLGTIGSMILVHFIYENWSGERDDIRKILLGVGVILPDLFDKPFGGLIAQNGRWLGHSIVFQTFIFMLLLTIYNLNGRRIKEIFDQKWIVYLYIGSLFHLVTDIGSLDHVTILWPFFGPFVAGTRYGFLEGAFAVSNIVTEVIGMLAIIIVGIFESWTKRTWINLTVFVLIYILTVFILFMLLFGF